MEKIQFRHQGSSAHRQTIRCDVTTAVAQGVEYFTAKTPVKIEIGTPVWTQVIIITANEDNQLLNQKVYKYMNIWKRGLTIGESPNNESDRLSDPSQLCWPLIYTAIFSLLDLQVKNYMLIW